MKARIRKVEIKITTDQGEVVKSFRSLAEVMDFIGELHPVAGEAVQQVKKFSKMARAMKSISEAME